MHLVQALRCAPAHRMPAINSPHAHWPLPHACTCTTPMIPSPAQEPAARAVCHAWPDKAGLEKQDMLHQTTKPYTPTEPHRYTRQPNATRSAEVLQPWALCINRVLTKAMGTPKCNGSAGVS